MYKYIKESTWKYKDFADAILDKWDDLIKAALKADYDAYYGGMIEYHIELDKDGIIYVDEGAAGSSFETDEVYNGDAIIVFDINREGALAQQIDEYFYDKLSANDFDRDVITDEDINNLVDDLVADDKQVFEDELVQLLKEYD